MKPLGCFWTTLGVLCPEDVLEVGGWKGWPAHVLPGSEAESGKDLGGIGRIETLFHLTHRMHETRYMTNEIKFIVISRDFSGHK